MNVIPTSLSNCVVIEPTVHRDHRGLFLESYHAQRFSKEAGIDLPFVQHNFSVSIRGVLRGLHFQHCQPQGKLVRVTRGEIFDVAVDIRPGSPSFAQWFGLTLSSVSHRQFWVPPGFAHGFLVLSDVAEVEYKCTAYYDPEDEACIAWNDPTLAIAWPGAGDEHFKLSDRDSSAQSFDELCRTMGVERYR